MSKRESVAFGKLCAGVHTPTPADRLESLHQLAEVARAYVKLRGLASEKILFEVLEAAVAKLDGIEARCRGGG